MFAGYSFTIRIVSALYFLKLKVDATFRLLAYDRFDTKEVLDMNAVNRTMLDNRIRQYMIEKIRAEFAEDFQLIEKDIEKLIERYNLKELIIIARLEIDRIKNPRFKK